MHERKVDFIIIGAMRAGTTSLYHELAMHPKIGMSREKETDFFIAKDPKKTPGWYQGQFDIRKNIWGEASPNYTKFDIFPNVAKRIHEYSPSMKFIFLARDPVARLISHYHHALYLKRPLPPPDQLLLSPQGRHMLACSKYHFQLETYKNLFPMSQILVIDYEAFLIHRLQALQKIAWFLDVENELWSDANARLNSSASLGANGAIFAQLRERTWLRKIYQHIPHHWQNQLKNFHLMKNKSAQVVFDQKLTKAIYAELKEDIDAFSLTYQIDTTAWKK